MSVKNINLNDKNTNKSTFYKKKNLSNIDIIDVDKVLISKKKYMAQKTHIDTLLDIMTTISLYHYV